MRSQRKQATAAAQIHEAFTFERLDPQQLFKRTNGMLDPVIVHLGEKRLPFLAK